MLKRHDSFGGRTVVPFEQYRNIKELLLGSPLLRSPGYSKESDEKYHMKSLLTVIADSATCILWTLDKAALSQSMIDNSLTMPEGEQKMLFEQFVRFNDPDRSNYKPPEIAFIRKEQKKWENFK